MDIIKETWYLLTEPWGDGTTVLAGSPDPHRGKIICQNEFALFNPESYFEFESDFSLANTKTLISQVMKHIVEIHNEWLEVGEEGGRKEIITSDFRPTRREVFMITKSEYNKHNNVYWTGRKVTTLVDLENSLIKIKAGSILTIADKRSGFTLESEKCPSCSVSVFIRKVLPQKLKLLDK